MKGIRKKANQNLLYENAFENYFEYSCFTDQFIFGMDTFGELGDLISFEECFECSIYENIKRIESLKNALNTEYIKHISIAKNILNDQAIKQESICFDGIMVFDLDTWMEHVKEFYITILSKSDLYEKMHINGVFLDDIENAIEMLIRLEEHILENRKEMEREIWN